MPSLERIQTEQHRLMLRASMNRDAPQPDLFQFHEVLASMHSKTPYQLAAIIDDLGKEEHPFVRSNLLHAAKQILKDTALQTVLFRDGHYSNITLLPEDLNHMEATWAFYHQAIAIIWNKECDLKAFFATGKFPERVISAPASHFTEAYQEMMATGDFASEFEKMGNLPVQERWTWSELGGLDALAYNIMLARDKESADEMRARASRAAGPTATQAVRRM